MEVKDSENAGITIGSITSQPLNLLIFNSENGWENAKSRHPTLSLTVSINKQDYVTFERHPPSIDPFELSVVADTGAQSCLWGLNNFLRSGFTEADLIPVHHSLYAANKVEIPVSGAILLRLSGLSPTGQTHTAAVMVYVSPSSNKFYLSEQALIQLNVIPESFPQLGGALLQQSAIHNSPTDCNCQKRTKAPPLPEVLPFECVPTNNDKMREWLIDYFSTSTF